MLKSMRDHNRQVSHFVHRALLLPLLLVGIFSFTPNAAHAVDRNVVFNFLPPSGSVTGYVFYIVDMVAFIEEVYDVGFIPRNSDDIARAVIVLDAETPYRARMTAYNARGESFRSNAIWIDAEVCDSSLCDDGNPCTVDTCEPRGCFNDDLPDLICQGGPASVLTLQVSTTISHDVAIVSVALSGGVGPYQFLFDCGADGDWDGIFDKSHTAKQYFCLLGGLPLDINVYAWDRATGAAEERLLSVPGPR